MSYQRLEQEQEKPKRLADHSAAWAKLAPLAAVNGQVQARIEAFCAEKRISFAALEALGTRLVVEPSSGGVALAWGYEHNGAVTALKFRPLGDKRRYAAEPSVYIEPLVIGKRDSLDWFAAEGETDACRLYDFVGDVAAILVLPAGARTFKREWTARIPRGATVHLCHDADEPGDKGADKAAAILGAGTVRVRPPVEGGDWCDWPGDRDMFVELVRAARGSTVQQYEFAPLGDFLTHPYPVAEPLLGQPGSIILATGSLLLVYGAEGTGKSTWTIDAIAHLAAGSDWLDIPVARPARICVIENEGPPSLFQEKLKAKAATWQGPAWTHNVYVFQGPWGAFSFADADARNALTAFCEEHRIDVVTANPTLGLGVAASGRPDETQQFVDWLAECGLKSTRAFWLLHHENKAGQISGDWGRHPDTKVQLQADGNRPRTKLTWEKTRWATLPNETTAKSCMLEWVTETESYTITQLDTVGASDSELETRIVSYLTEHPWATTRSVYAGVQGTQSRIRSLLDSDRFDCVEGPRSSILWNTANDCVGSSDDTPTQDE